MKLTQISILDGVVIFGYISFLVFAGIWISRRNKSGNSSSSEELFYRVVRCLGTRWGYPFSVPMLVPPCS